MRIALVCPTYIPGRSYQENLWAEQLARLSHDVRVFLPNEPGHPHGLVERVEVPGGVYERQYAATRKLPRGTYWPRRMHELVRNYKPELIVIFGDKTYSVKLVRDESLRDVPVISTYSENLGMHEYDWRKPGISLRQRVYAVASGALRGGPMRAVCRRSNLIVGNTPQARDILLRLFPAGEQSAIERKYLDMPLGFSPEHFGYRPETRLRVRQQLGVGPDDVLVCVSSHFSPTKEPFVLLIINALRAVMDQDPSLKAVVVGFTEDPRYIGVSRRIAEHLAQGRHADRLLRESFANRERLCELYNAADIAAFGRVSISCQEALATGLVACFANDGSMNHLVKFEDQAVFFRPNDQDDLARVLGQAVQRVRSHEGAKRHEFRERCASAARWLGYDRIIGSLLERVTKSHAGNAN
jgi:glycosyltransferase involved in cell wall biosynthesis